MKTKQTRTIGLAHLDRFSHIGVFSGGSIAVTNITDMAAFKKKVKPRNSSSAERNERSERIGGLFANPATHLPGEWRLLQNFLSFGIFRSFRPSNCRIKVKLVFVSYGSRELGGDRTNRGGDPKANTEALKAAGINAHFYVSPDTAHEWQSWRRSLHEFAPLVFKN